MSKNPECQRFGLGLRSHQFTDLHSLSALPLLEIITDQLVHHQGGPALWHTDRLSARTPTLLHGVGIDLGGAAAFDESYINGLKELIQRYQPLVVSDHLAFTRGGGVYSYELLPLPRTKTNLQHVAARIHHLQERLNRQFTVENISAYVSYNDDEFSEGEFFTELVQSTGCGILLDVNNLFVNAHNFGFDALSELKRFPLAAVTQIHIAGHIDRGDYLFDTHDQKVRSEVITLLHHALQLLSKNIPVILERDDHVTSLEQSLQEISEIKTALENSSENNYVPVT